MAQHEILSPLPGTLYRRPNPTADPYVTEGQRVEAGDTVCLVEIMKQFHEVKAGVNGVLKEFLLENEDSVSPGQSIAIIDAD